MNTTIRPLAVSVMFACWSMGAQAGDFSNAVDDAILDSNTAHQNQMIQLLSDPKKAASFARVVFDLLVSGKSNPVA